MPPHLIQHMGFDDYCDGSDSSEGDEAANKIFDALAPVVTDMLSEEDVSKEDLIQRVGGNQLQRSNTLCVVEVLPVAGKCQPTNNG